MTSVSGRPRRRDLPRPRGAQRRRRRPRPRSSPGAQGDRGHPRHRNWWRWTSPRSPLGAQGDRRAERRRQDLRPRRQQCRRHGLPQGATADGFETSSAPIISAISSSPTGSAISSGRAARLISLSSAGHRFADVDLEDPNFETTRPMKSSSPMAAQTANALFAVGVDRRQGSRRARACGRPSGGIATELSRHMTPGRSGHARQYRQGAGRGGATFEWKTIPTEYRRRRPSGPVSWRRPGCRRTLCGIATSPGIVGRAGGDVARRRCAATRSTRRRARTLGQKRRWSTSASDVQ